MRFLIAGLGSIGRRHLRNLVILGEQDIILYRTHRSTLPEAELSGFPVETDLDAALSKRPDAVIIANPSALHLEVAIPAARAGCHLFLEKPVSHSIAGIENLQAAVQDTAVQVLVGFQFRFHPGLKTTKQLLNEGAIGRPISVRAHWGEYLPDWHPWEDYRASYSARAELGGGVVLTLCHPLDYLRWFLGEVVALWAFSGKLSDLDLHVEDCAEIGLRFASDVLGSVHLDYTQRPTTHYLEIIGTQGTLRWDNSDGAVNIFDHESANWRVFPVPGNFERNQLFLAEMEHFLAVCRGETEPVCKLNDGIRALELALGVLTSEKEKRLVNF